MDERPSLQFRTRRCLLLAGLVCLLGCSTAGERPASQVAPVLVIGASMTTSPSAAAPRSEAPSPPSASPSREPVRPAPSSGLYPAPTWDWLVLGDTVVERTFRLPGTWKEVWNAAYLMEAPRIVEEAASGEQAEAGRARLDEMVARYPNAKFAGVAYGAADCLRKVPVATFKTHLKAIVSTLQAHGVRPLLATIAYSEHPSMANVNQYNQAIEQVQAELNAGKGPDLYRFALDNPPYRTLNSTALLTPDGYAAAVRLWAEAVARETLAPPPDLESESTP